MKPESILIITLFLASIGSAQAQTYPSQQRTTQPYSTQRPAQRAAPRPYAPPRPVTVPTPQRSPWTLFFAPGYRFSPKDETTVKSASGSSLGTSSRTEKPGFLVDAEANYKLMDSSFSFSGVFEWTQYAFQAGSPSDTQIGVLVMPRIEKEFEALILLWAGLGLGVMNTAFGTSSGNAGSTNITFSNTSVWSFAWSPRVGVDYEISPGVLAGLYFSYISFSGSVDAAVSGGGLNTTLTADFTRSWMSACARIGFRL